MVRKFIVSHAGKTLPTSEAGDQFFFFIINSVGKSPENHKQEMQKCLSYSLVPGLPLQLSSLAVRITVRSVICTASDDSYGGLGTRLQVMHEISRICRFAHAKLVTFELIF